MMQIGKSPVEKIIIVKPAVESSGKLQRGELLAPGQLEIVYLPVGDYRVFDCQTKIDSHLKLIS